MVLNQSLYINLTLFWWTCRCTPPPTGSELDNFFPKMDFWKVDWIQMMYPLSLSPLSLSLSGNWKLEMWWTFFYGRFGMTKVWCTPPPWKWKNGNVVKICYGRFGMTKVWCIPPPPGNEKLERWWKFFMADLAWLKFDVFVSFDHSTSWPHFDQLGKMSKWALFWMFCADRLRFHWDI